MLPKQNSLIWIQNHQIKTRERLLRAASGESRDDLEDDSDVLFGNPFGILVEVI